MWIDDIDLIIELLNSEIMIGYKKQLPYECLMHYLFSEALLGTNFTYFPIFKDANFCDAFCCNINNPYDMWLIEHKWHGSSHNFLPHNKLATYQNKYFEKNINVVQAFSYDSALHNTFNHSIYPDLLNNKFFNGYSRFNNNKYLIGSSEYKLRVEELNQNIARVQHELKYNVIEKNSFIQSNKHLINRQILKGTELGKLLLKK